MNLARFSERIEGLKYLVDKMELTGSRVRRYLMRMPFSSDRDLLEGHFDILQKACEILSDQKVKPVLMQLEHLFSKIHDIQGTLTALKEKRILDEVELFEIKHFSVICADAAALCLQAGFVHENLYPLQEAFNMLDPDHTGTVSFYIYDSYSKSLAEARKQVASIDPGRDAGTWDRLQDIIQKEELAVREKLSLKLAVMYRALQENFDRIAWIEIWFAKARLALMYNMVRPETVPYDRPGVLSVVEMVNPAIADTLENAGEKFQPVSVTLNSEPCLLTGANMSGKTVVLKTLALIQALTQFSFFVPAQKASIPLVKDVFLVIGDKQDQYRGLSSFAAEMLDLDRIMANMAVGTKMLILADEPARTTNPAEGAAILCAFVEYLEKHGVMSLISTHYGDLGLSCRKLRVAGFQGSNVKGRLDPLRINRYMNYSLIEDKGGSVPLEALNIARLLGVDESFIDTAKKYLK